MRPTRIHSRSRFWPVTASLTTLPVSHGMTRPNACETTARIPVRISTRRCGAITPKEAAQRCEGTGGHQGLTRFGPVAFRDGSPREPLAARQREPDAGSVEAERPGSGSGSRHPGRRSGSARCARRRDRSRPASPREPRRRSRTGARRARPDRRRAARTSAPRRPPRSPFQASPARSRSPRRRPVAWLPAARYAMPSYGAQLSRRSSHHGAEPFQPRCALPRAPSSAPRASNATSSTLPVVAVVALERHHGQVVGLRRRVVRPVLERPFARAVGRRGRTARSGPDRRRHSRAAAAVRDGDREVVDRTRLARARSTVPTTAIIGAEHRVAQRTLVGRYGRCRWRGTRIRSRPRDLGRIATPRPAR